MRIEKRNELFSKFTEITFMRVWTPATSTFNPVVYRWRSGVICKMVIQTENSTYLLTCVCIMKVRLNKNAQMHDDMEPMKQWFSIINMLLVTFQEKISFAITNKRTHTHAQTMTISQHFIDTFNNIEIWEILHCDPTFAFKSIYEWILLCDFQQTWKSMNSKYTQNVHVI